MIDPVEQAFHFSVVQPDPEFIRDDCRGFVNETRNAGQFGVMG